MQPVVNKFPELNDFGFGIYFRDRAKPPDEQRQIIAQHLAKLFEERSLRQFAMAREWLGNKKRIRLVNPPRWIIL